MADLIAQLGQMLGLASANPVDVERPVTPAMRTQELERRWRERASALRPREGDVIMNSSPTDEVVLGESPEDDVTLFQQGVSTNEGGLNTASQIAARLPTKRRLEVERELELQRLDPNRRPLEDTRGELALTPMDVLNFSRR